MYALIDCVTEKDGGYALCQVQVKTFPVTLPFRWVECPDATNTVDWICDKETYVVHLISQANKKVGVVTI